MTYKGAFEGEWVFEAPVRFLMVTGGPPGRESVLVGLRSGQVVKVILGNWFPVSVLRHGGDAPTAASTASTQRAERGVRCLDLNRSRSLLALVDERAVLAVYDVTGTSTARECIFQVRLLRLRVLLDSYLLVHVFYTGQESNATSCTWNTQFDNMLGVCVWRSELLQVLMRKWAVRVQRTARRARST